MKQMEHSINKSYTSQYSIPVINEYV